MHINKFWNNHGSICIYQIQDVIHSFPMFPFYPPENIRKPMISDVFRIIKREKQEGMG